MYKFGKTRISNKHSLRFRIGVAAFLIGTGIGYIFTDDNLAVAQVISLSEQVKTVLFIRNQPVEKDG
ncbi:MAG TPA: hypothetical protein VF571_07525 [Pyrinomonadaceae bacterium]|jgi:uncharacterized membrane protein